MATFDELVAKLKSEASGCYSWSNGPHDRYAAHTHNFEKVLYCVDGSITFVLESEGKRLELKPGDRRRRAVRMHLHRGSSLRPVAPSLRA